MESSSRVRSESMEPMSCRTSPVLRLLLKPSDGKDILGSRWLTSSLRTLFSFGGQPIDIPGLLGEVDAELEHHGGFQSGILEGEERSGCGLHP